jgi:hypothetical protein
MAQKDTPPDGEQPQEEQPPTLKERIESAAYVAYGQHDLVTKDGEPDQEALIQQVFDIVSVAVVERPSERAKNGVSRASFMDQIFPKVPGKAEWIDQEDPELAEGVYKSLDSDIWRLLNVNPDGPVQAMLNGEKSMVLCRVDASRTHEAHAYVTRNRKCLYEDYSAKARAAIERAVNQHAALMAQAINRIPEQGPAFLREFDGATRVAVNSGQGVVKGALESGAHNKDADADEASEE